MPADLPDRYGRLIQSYFYSRLQDREAAADLCQELWVRAAAAYIRFEGKSKISTWLYGICHNVLREYKREQDRIQQREKQDEEQDTSDLLEDKGWNRSYSRIELELALSLLDTKDKRLFRLYYQEGLTIAELASLFDRPEGTIKYWLYNLRKKSAKLLLMDD